MAEANETLSVTEAANILAPEPAPETEKPVERAEPVQAQSEDDPPETEATPDEAQPETDADAEDAPDDEGDQPAEETPAEDDADPVSTVRLDGKDVQVKQSELLQGYQRQADYTRKTQELSEKRKTVEAAEAQTREALTVLAYKLEQAESLLKEAVGPEPDWDRLYQEDPLAYPKVKHDYDRRLQRLQQVNAERQRATQAQRMEAERQAQARLASESARLLDIIPSWRDAETAKTEKSAVAEYAVKTLGFTAEEVGSAADARAIAALHKAWKYDQLQAKKPEVAKKVTAAKPLQRPGTAKPAQSSQRSEADKAMSRLTKTGKLDDAVRVLMARQG